MQRVPSCGNCFRPFAFKGSGRPVGQRIPRLLCCGHTFCDACTTKLVEIRPHVLECPTCKGETALVGGKKLIKNLPTNLYILGILINNVRATIEKDISNGELTDFDIEKGFFNTNVVGGQSEAKELAKDGTPREETAKFCDECCTNHANCGCQKCDAIFCQNCFDNVHLSSRTLRSHKAVPLSLADLAEVSSQTCETHQGRELEFYDQIDDKFICSLCIVTPTYQSHKVVSASEVTVEVAEKVKQSLQNVKKVHSCLMTSKGKLSSLSPEIKTECSELVQQIREHFQDLHTKLQAREITLIGEVKAAFCSKSFPAEVVKEIALLRKELETLIEQSTAALSVPSMIMKIGDILQSKMAVFEDAPCILSESLVQDLVKISYPDEFQTALNSYGSVLSENRTVTLKKISEQDECASIENYAQESSGSPSHMVEDEANASALTAKSNGALLTLPSRQNLVYVTHVKNPCDFMVQHVADNERIENLMDAINNYCEAAKSLDKVVKTTQVGDLVCAQYSVDQCWYRARIVGKQQRTSTPKGRNQPLPEVEVYFVDYGNTEVVMLNKLRKIPPEFTDAPELATNCSLIDVVPPGHSVTWPAQSIKAFGSLIRDKALLMGVVKKSSGKLLVDLKSPDEEPTKDDDKPASVRDALVFLEVAHFSSPASNANPEVAFPVRVYKKVEIPEEGETVQVTVTYTESPNAIYVMRDTGEEYANTLRIIGQMSAMYSTKKGYQWQIVWPYKGLVCAARFSGDQVWYRALVTDVTADQTVQVYYVDFGNSERLPFSEIRRIPDHMTQLSMQAMKCRLAGIQPADQGGVWSNECCTFLADRCSLNQYNIQVVEAEGEDYPMEIIMYDADSQKVTSVNQQLVLSLYAAPSASSDVLSLESLPVNVEEPSSPASNASMRNCDASISSTDSDQGRLLFPQKLSYLNAVMPNTSKFQFAVSYVDKDCTIYGCQPGNSDHSLPELMKLVQNICKENENSLVSQDQLSFNQPCCAEFSDDNLWYRAQVVDFPTPSSVLVDYVDFGNTAKIPLSCVNLNAAFLDIPKQCLAIQLDGLPQTPAEQAKVSQLLESLLIGQKCEAATSVMSLVRVPGVIKVDRLTLPDGTDVVEAASDMMMRQLESKPETNQPSYAHTTHDESKVTERIKPIYGAGKSLLSDTVLPPVGVPFDVSVTQVDSKSVVYLQRSPQTDENPGLSDGHDPTHYIAYDHLLQLVNVSNRINLLNYFNNKPSVNDVWSKMLCCAQYTEDDLWYRAQVVKVVANDPLRAQVLYVDYGTSEVIELDRMKPFPGELLSLPKQAFQCKVIGLSESDDEDDESPDYRKAVYFLTNAVADKKLICKIVSFGSPIVVELYERVFNEESYQDIPLSQRLSELQLIMDMSDDLEEDMKDDVASDDEHTLIDQAESNDALTDNAVSSEAPSDEELTAKEEKSIVEMEGVQPGELTTNVTPARDWCAESEENSAINYNREVMSTRPQLLTPAQFLLKRESLVEAGDAAKTKEPTVSEVD